LEMMKVSLEFKAFYTQIKIRLSADITAFKRVFSYLSI